MSTQWKSGDTGKFAGIPFVVTYTVLPSDGCINVQLEGHKDRNAFDLDFFDKHAVKDLPKYNVGDYVILFPQEGNETIYLKSYISQIGRVYKSLETGLFKGHYEVKFGNGMFQTVKPEDLKPSA